VAEGVWVAEPVFIPPKWRKPAPLGYANAIDSVGSVAAPLLAGFSLASVIIISDDAVNFRWPGAAILGLAIAAVTLVGAVQCAFNARQYIWSGTDVREWWPDMEENSKREQLLRAEQERAFYRWQTWTAWTRRTYEMGILALLAALALALPPQHAMGIQGSLRWAGSGVAFAACAGEVCWIAANSWRASRQRRRNRKYVLSGVEK
jgi:hypothetical protein